MPTKTTDYPFIEYFGRRLGSHSWYVQEQMAKAAEDGAPLSAVHERSKPGGGRSHEWSTLDDVTSTDLLEWLLIQADNGGHPVAAALVRNRLEELTGAKEERPFFESDYVCVEADERPHWYVVKAFGPDSEVGLLVHETRDRAAANEYAERLAMLMCAWAQAQP